MRKLYLLLAIFLVTQSNMFAQFMESNTAKKNGVEYTPPTPQVVIKTTKTIGGNYKSVTSPLTGVKTIKASGGDYSSFNAAIADLNAYGVGVGGVIFKVDAGTTFYEAPNWIVTTTSSATNPIVFQKEGAGANPIIYGKIVGGSDWDVILGISGADYITFDGIDLVSDPSATLDADKIECGIGIYNNGTNGCNHITIKNCSITIERRTDNVGQRGIDSYQDATSSTGITSNLLVDNVTFIKGRTSISLYAQTIPNESVEISNCKIGEPATTIEPLNNYGSVVYLWKCKNYSFHDNEIQNAISANFYAMRMKSCSGENKIFNNKIHKFYATATGDNDLYGIESNGADNTEILNFYNNLIYDFDGAKSTSVYAPNPYWNLQLICLNGSAKYRVYNNTVIGSSVNQHENTVLCWVTPNSEIKNNIFADYSLPGTNSFRMIFLSVGVVENNLLWMDESPVNNFVTRGSSNYKFKEWQRLESRPSLGYFLNNIFANPNFVDRNNFDFTPQSPSPASNNGQPLGVVTSSINGVARNATSPDIGCYEGDFGPKTDMYPPVIRFQPIPHNSLDAVKLVAEITDNVGVVSAKLWFRTKGSSDAFAQVLGVQFGNTWEFNFPALNPGVYEYFVCAKDASENVISNGFGTSGLDETNTGLTVNNPSANPDYVYCFSYKQSFTGGTYTVGIGGAYESLTKPGGLFDAINSSLIAGNIDVRIISDLDETGEIALQQWQESGNGNYTITIKPSSAVLKTITNNTAKPITILGADRITIDGSYNGDNNNHFKFVAPSAISIELDGDKTNGCDNVSIKYCDFDSRYVCWTNGVNHSNILIDHISSQNGECGVVINNVNAVSITNSFFGNTNVLNSIFGSNIILDCSGIQLNSCSNIIIEKNTIMNITCSYVNGATRGIYLNNVNAGRINRNNINGLVNNSTVGNGVSNGLCVVSSKDLTVSNNIISGVNGHGNMELSYTYGIKGVVLANCDNLKFYYNTVNLYGTGNTVSNGECFSLSTENSVNLDICNNILSNTIDNTSSSFTMAVAQPRVELSNIFRNNIHYVGGSKAYLYPFYIGSWSNFKQWQSNGYTPGSGRDLGSCYADSKFTNSALNDVSLQASSPAINSGIPLSITTDFNGNARSVTTPDIGAIEDNSFALTVDNIAPVIDYVPIASSLNTTPSLSAIITDNVGVTAAKMWYRVQNSTAAFTGINGVKQGDNKTWNFAITSSLTTNTGYEYFVCAKDAANNIVTNGITESDLDVTTVGLTNNAPAAHPLFVRTFRVEVLSITLGTITGAPFYVGNNKTASVNIPFTKTGTYNNGNLFTAYLSDANGSFASETPIGYITSGTDNEYEGDYQSVGFRKHPNGTTFNVNAKLQFIALNANTVHKTQVGDYNGYGLDITITTNTIDVGGTTCYTCDLQITNLGTASQVVYATDDGGNPMNYYNPVTKVFELYYGYIPSGGVARKIRETNTRIVDNGYIGGTINSLTPSGTGYRIRIKSSAPAGVVSNISPDFQIIKEDNVSPVVTLTTSATTPAFEPFTVNVDFNEDVQSFEQSMITVTNAVLSNFTSVIASKKYTVLVTPTNSGVVTVKVEAGKVKDLADNFNGESNTISLSYIELGVPRLSISAAGGVVYFNTSSIDLTFTFDQDVTGFVAGDISVNNGSVAGFAGSGKVYTATLSPSGQGQVKVSVADDVVVNAASKGNSASSLNLIFDNQKPGLSISRVSGSGVVNSAFDIYLDFTEEVIGMSLDKITVTNGTPSNLVKESSTRYRTTINPSINSGTITINFSADVITDLANNNNTAATSLDVPINSTQPVVTVSRTSGTGKVNGVFNITFTFGADVTGFIATDIVITNGTLGTLMGSGASYTIDVTPSVDGDVKIKVPQDVAQDAATNLNLASNELIVVADMTAPTVTLSRTAGSGGVNSTFNVSISFSEVVSGFDMSDITVNGATLSNFTGSGSLYQVDVTPTISGDVTLSLAANKATDYAGNNNTASNSLVVAVDAIAPTVVITRTSGSGPVNAKYNVTLTFSEDVIGFDISDISVIGATLSNFTGGGSLYQVDVTPTITGDLTISLAANKVTDHAGNGNIASNSLVVVADITAPTVVISRTSGTGSVNAKFNATFTFSEDVTGFIISDISVTNGVTSNFVATSAKIYSVDVTPTVAGNVTINVAASVAQDLVGNSNIVASPLIVDYITTDVEVITCENTRVFPNPSAGVFKIEVNNLLNQVVKIYNLNGKLVYSGVLKEKTTNIEMLDAPKGAYLIQIIEEGRIDTRKLILY